jgi:hypothetical protein
MKRLLIVLGGLLGILVIGGAAALLLLDPAALADKQKVKLTAQLTEELGRAVSVGPITAKVFPVLAVEVRDVRVAGASAESPALLRVGKTELRFSFWRALMSLGKDLEVRSFALRDVEAHVARDEDGRWSFDDILARRAERAPPASADEPPTDLSFLEGVRVDRAELAGVSVTIADAALGRPLTIKDLGLVLENVRLGAPLAANLVANLVDSGKSSPITLSARFEELPKDLSFDPVPAGAFALTLAQLDVAPWGGLVPADGFAPAAGTLQAKVRLKTGVGLERFEGEGTLGAKGLVLRDGYKRGQPMDAELDFGFDVDTNKPRYEIRRLNVVGTGLELKAQVLAARPSLAALERADVDAKVADLSRLLAALPQGMAALPEELSLAGPLSLRLMGNAKQVEANLNLDAASVRWGDSFEKPRNRPLNLSLKGTQKGDALRIEPFALQVDTARIEGTMDLPLDDKAPMRADIKSGAIQLASLQEVIPPFKKALSRGDRVRGAMQLELVAKSAGGKQEVHARLGLRDLDMALEETTAKGIASLLVDVVPQEAVLSLKAEADLTELALQSMNEGQVVLDKPAGVPARLAIDVTRSDKRADVKQALLAVGKTTVSATGSATGLDTKASQLALDFGRVDLAFDDLRRALPGAGALPAGGSLRGAVKVTGSPEALATVVVDAKDLDVSFGGSRMKGAVRVRGLDEMALEADLASVTLAFDDLRALGVDAVPAGGRYEGSLKLVHDSKQPARGNVQLVARALKVGRSDLAGTAEVRNLSRPNFAFDLAGDQVDVDELLELFGSDEEPTSSKKKPKSENPHGLPRSARDSLRKVDGKGTLKAKRVVFEQLPMEKFTGSFIMKAGVVRFEALDFRLYDGDVTAAGTTFDLPATHTGYALKLAVKRLDLGRALAAHTELGQVLSGRVSKDVDVSGRGLTKADLIKTLTGPTVVRSESLQLQSLDVLGPIGRALEHAAKTIPGAPRIQSAASGGGTTFQDMIATLQLRTGAMHLQNPLQSKTSFGAMSLEGGAGLEDRLDFTGIVELSPQTLARMTSGYFKANKGVEVPVKIVGTWAKPRVEGIDVARLARSVFGDALKQGLQGLEDKAREEVAKRAGDEVGKALGDPKQSAKEKADEAKAKADEQTKKATADAKAKADDAKKKASDAAKKKADEARKKADAAAKKKADEAKKKAGDLFGR